MSLPPNKEELENFRRELNEQDIEIIREKLRHQGYGVKDSWRTKEAQARIQREEVAAEQKMKEDSLLLQAQGNKISEEANQIAKRALWTSLVALLISIVSIAVAIFK
jgi:hypothetical protein